jgi:hypothetical protein
MPGEGSTLPACSPALARIGGADLKDSSLEWSGLLTEAGTRGIVRSGGAWKGGLLRITAAKGGIAQWKVSSLGHIFSPLQLLLLQVCPREPAPGSLLICLRCVDVWGDTVGDVLQRRGTLGWRPTIPHPASAGEGPSPAAKATPLL